MKEYDLIVIGTGSGMEIAQKEPGVRSKPTFKFHAKAFSKKDSVGSIRFEW
jgi:pyruvate/2-oxoglutarate dehydrogenase complex dihydrolipoamide dehydrogenase (E3) component